MISTKTPEDKDETARDSIRPDFLDQMGISPDEQKSMEDSARSGAAEDMSRASSLSPETLKDAESSPANQPSGGSTAAANEKSSLAGGSSQESDKSLWNPEEGEGKGKSKETKGGREKGITGLLIGLLIGGGIGTFGILQGPLQFIQIAKNLSRFHFSRQDYFSNGRTSKFLFYSFSGKAAKGRLGALSNTYADSWERRLNQNGLKSVYSSGTQRFIGFQVIDPVKAQHALADFNKAGIPSTAAPPQGSVGIDGPLDVGDQFVDISNDDYKKRRWGIKTAVKSAGVNTISSSLGTRLLKKRAGVDLHPLRNIARKRADSYAAYKQDLKNQRANDIETGRKNTPDSPAKKRRQEIRSEMQSFLRSARTPAVVATAVCGLKSFSSNIDAQQVENQLILIRYGMDKVAMGNQVQSGQDLNFEVLGAMSEYHYDEVTQTSWASDPGIQQELGEEPIGTDYAEGAKPGSARFTRIFDVVDEVPTKFSIVGGIPVKPDSGVPGIDACSVIEAAVNLPVVRHALDFIDAGVDLALQTLFNFDKDQFIQDSIAWFAGGGVDMHAAGAMMGGQANIGVRMAANDQFISNGAIELNEEDAEATKEEARREYAMEFRNGSIYDRYFDVYDTRSVAGQFIMRTPKTSTQLATSIMNLPATLGNSFTNLANLFGGRAAAEHVEPYDYGFPLFGYTLEEQNDDRFTDPYENEEELEKLFAERTRLENECLASGLPPEECDRQFSNITEMNTGKSTIADITYPMSGRECFGIEIKEDGSIRNHDTVIYEEIPETCKSKQEDWMRYRFHIADVVAGHTLACYDGQEVSCKQVGFGSSSSESSGSGSSGNLPPGDAATLAQQIIDSPNVNSDHPAQLQNIANGQGPCPERNNGEYTVDVELLRVIAALAQNNSFTISSFHRGCTGSTVGSGSKSRHWRGKAVDISGSRPINGVTMGDSFNNYDESGTLQEFMNEAVALLPPGCEFGVPNNIYLKGVVASQPACKNIFLDNRELTGASGPHVHIGVP